MRRLVIVDPLHGVAYLDLHRLGIEFEIMDANSDGDGASPGEELRISFLSPVSSFLFMCEMPDLTASCLDHYPALHRRVMRFAEILEPVAVACLGESDWLRFTPFL
jgi:hypothetical protein